VAIQHENMHSVEAIGFYLNTMGATLSTFAEVLIFSSRSKIDHSFILLIYMKQFYKTFVPDYGRIIPTPKEEGT
jgi:hypothetical protein